MTCRDFYFIRVSHKYLLSEKITSSRRNENIFMIYFYVNVDIEPGENPQRRNVWTYHITNFSNC